MAWMLPAAVLGSAALGFFGQESTNDANLQIARDTSGANAEQAAINRAWQERMSNTAYQRAVGDMQAAGLNPMLAYQQGGASSPSGGAAQAVSATMGNSLGAGLNSAMAAADLTARVDNVRAQTRNTEANTRVAASQEDLNRAQGLRVAAQTASELEVPAYTRQRIAESISASALADANKYRLQLVSPQEYERMASESAHRREQTEELRRSLGTRPGSSVGLRLQQAHTAEAIARERETRQGIAIHRPYEEYAGTSWGRYAPYAHDISGAISSGAQAYRNFRGFRR